MTNKELICKALETLTEAFKQPNLSETLDFINKRALADPSVPLGLEVLQVNLTLIMSHVSLSMYLELNKSNVPTSE